MSWEDIIRKGVKAIAAQAKSIKEGLSDDELAEAKKELDAYLAERSLTRSEKSQAAFDELEKKLTGRTGPAAPIAPSPSGPSSQARAESTRPVDLSAVITPTSPAGTETRFPPPAAAPAASPPAMPVAPVAPPAAKEASPPVVPPAPVSPTPAEKEAPPPAPAAAAPPVVSPPSVPVTAPPAPPAVAGSPPPPSVPATATAPPSQAAVTAPAPPVTAALAVSTGPQVAPVVQPPTKALRPRERFRQDLKALLQGDFPLITVIAAESTNSARDIQATVEAAAMKHIAIENIVEFSNIPKLLLNPSEIRHSTTVVIRDAQLYAENKTFIRGLRQLKTELPGQPRRIKVILQSFGDLTLPGDLRYLPTLYFPLPDHADLEELVARMCGFIRERYHFPITVDEATGERLANLLLGQTYEQATETLLRTALRSQKLDGSVLAEIEADKYKNLSNTALQYLQVTPQAAQVGGFDNFHQFLELAHRTGVGEEALMRGHEPVKGVVMVGIPGAGKSQGAYMAAHVLNLPLFRANLDAILGKYVGESEAGLRDLLRQVDALGPSVIWIDEIEKALGGGQSDSSGVQTKLTGILLTWLQENRRVFIYATANDITRLPPEILRTGRLDKTFFVSLPNQPERVLIFDIHLRKRGLDPARFDVPELSRVAEGYTGGEIEQAVKDAFRQHGHDLTTDQVLASLDNVVPLSVSRAEEIRALEEWGATRAVCVSGDGTDSIFRARLVEWVETSDVGRRTSEEGALSSDARSSDLPKTSEVRSSDAPSPRSSLKNLRTWIRKRRSLDAEKAQAMGLQPPRGILVVGVPGSDQSAVAAAVAQELERPLLRIGVERLLAETETKLQTIDRVLQNRTLVAWIDEAEVALVDRLIAWLRNYPPIFAVFTTNDPGNRLPPSLLRGRIGLSEQGGLNEVFFVDLPGREELEAIFQQLLITHRVSLEGIDLPAIVEAAQGFSAREAALVVEEALIEALSDNGRPLSTDDLLRALQTRVPSSKVRAEEIETVRNWAQRHALPAQ